MTDPVDAIMHVMRAAFDDRYGEAWSRKQVSDAIILPHTHYLLGSADESGPANPSATTGFTLSRGAAGEEELLLIAVHPDWRERGEGRKLMQRFLDAAAARGTRRVFLEMRADNPAEHLYLRCGFSRIGVRPGYYRGAVGSPLDAITFARDI